MPVRGYAMEKEEYLTRLRKIEGQVRGLQRMIDDDTYRIGVINRSAQPAPRQFPVGLLDQRIRHLRHDCRCLIRR